MQKFITLSIYYSCYLTGVSLYILPLPVYQVVDEVASRYVTMHGQSTRISQIYYVITSCQTLVSYAIGFLTVMIIPISLYPFL